LIAAVIAAGHDSLRISTYTFVHIYFLSSNTCGGRQGYIGRGRAVREDESKENGRGAQTILWDKSSLSN
jgi:hypothetical protein